MSLDLFLAVLCVLLAGITVKTLILYASTGIQVDRAQQRATEALMILKVLEPRITQLETDLYGDEGEDEND